MSKEIKRFDKVITASLIKNKKFLLKRPSYLKTFLEIGSNIKKQVKVRTALAKDDLIVPPVLILSITNDCNLTCKGCYACDQQRDKSGEMDISEIKRIVDESVELGVAIILIAGGEPLLKDGILDIPKEHPGTLFVMFTNGLLIDTTVMNELKHTKNLIPIVSLEGNKKTTDDRRGEGVYDKIMAAIEKLDKNTLLFGSSFTLTNKNYDEVVSSRLLRELQDKGSRAAFLIEYVPSGDADMDQCISDKQKEDLISKEFDLDMLIVPLPGDEEKYGGCLASGRGFLHISSTGAIEACPFAPFSDVNVTGTSMKEALRSPLLKKIRDNHHLLKESKGGCALNENKEWIEELTRNQ